MYSLRLTHGPADLAFTDRFGGVSASPYDELNLGVSGGDDADAKAENHRRVLADFAPGDGLCDLYQVHGADVVEAAADWPERPHADGIVTGAPGLTLLVRAADCVPVLFVAPDEQIIGAAHAGRPGMVAGVVPATVGRMRDLGADRVEAWIGPHVCGRCYEVPEEMRSEVAAVVPASYAETSWGTPSVDLGAGVRSQLEELDVVVHDASRCTRESPDLYSYRRDGAASGRLAGLVRLEARRMTRREEIAAGLARVRERIAAACADAGRAPDEVGLVVVTKFFPADDVRLLAELGVTDVGENRHQEAEAKAAECADLDLTWHFIGGLQSNKAAAVATYAAVVESVDRRKLVRPLSQGAHRRDRPVDVLLQVSLDPPGSEGRSGAEPTALADLAAAVDEAGQLRLRGLMAVAPLGEDPAAAFGRLAGIRAEFLAHHPAATWLSAGMSGDLEHAIRAGATHVRVGSAVLGSRPPNK